MLESQVSLFSSKICLDLLFSGYPGMTVFNCGAIRYRAGKVIKVLPEVIEIGTVGTCLDFPEVHTVLSNI